jgi:hypothetical protein
MHEQPSRNPISEPVILTGELQVNAAIMALQMTELDPRTETELRARRDLAGLTARRNNGRPVTVRLQTASARDSLITSALVAQQNENLAPIDRMATSGLLDVLGVEQD